MVITSVLSRDLRDITAHPVTGMYVPPPPGTDTTRTANVYAHSRSYGFGREVQKRILLGTYALTAECVHHIHLLLLLPRLPSC